MENRIPYPSFEIIKPVCSHGHEIAPLYYSIFAKKSFDEFSKFFEIPDNMKEVMDFKTEEALKGLKLCCLTTIRYGGTISISVIQEEQEFSQRKYPEALPGPHSRGNRIYWA